MSTLSSANVTDVNLVLKERTHMRLCINMLIFTHNLGNWLIVQHHDIKFHVHAAHMSDETLGKLVFCCIGCSRFHDFLSPVHTANAAVLSCRRRQCELSVRNFVISILL